MNCYQNYYKKCIVLETRFVRFGCILSYEFIMKKTGRNRRMFTALPNFLVYYKIVVKLTLWQKG